MKLTKKKREKEIGIYPIATKIKVGCYEQLVNLDRMVKFLERHLSNLTREKIDNLNRALCTKALN